MALRLDLTFQDEDVEKLIKLAILYGYKRTSPGRSWSSSEKKDAARFAVNQTVRRQLRE